MPISSGFGYTPGDVVVVPFPCADRFARKLRPALVVSNEKLGGQGFLWLVMITSARNLGMAHDVPIDDSAEAGLPAPSVVRPAKIATLEPSRVVRRVGRLDQDKAAAVFAMVRSFIGR